MDTENKWSTNQWEAYLSELEVEQAELLFNQPETVEAMPDEYYREGFSELMGTNYSEKLSNMISLLMQSLTKKQRTVIELIFWESMSLNEIATHQGLSRSAIKNLRDRALATLSKILMEHREKINHQEAA